MNALQIFYVIGGVIVLLTLAAHISLYRRTIRFNRNGQQTVGTVVSHSWSSVSDGGRVCYPTIAYSVNNQQYLFQSNVGTNFPPQVGTTVTVVYDPTMPQRAQINSFTGEWLLPLFFSIFGLVGIVMIVVSVLIYPHTRLSGLSAGFGFIPIESLGSFILFLMGSIFSLVAAGLSYSTAKKL